MVSFPDPVASTYAAWLGPKIENEAEGTPLGDRFMCLPARGAEATKNTDCFRTQSRRSSAMVSKNATMATYFGGNNSLQDMIVSHTKI